MTPADRFSELLEKYIADACTRPELEELWLTIKQSNEFSTVDNALIRLWDDNSKKTPATSETIKKRVLETILQQERPQVPAKRRIIPRLWMKIAIAASILTIITIVIYFMIFNVKKVAPLDRTYAMKNSKPILAPAGARPVLHLSSGQQIELITSGIDTNLVADGLTFHQGIDRVVHYRSNSSDLVRSHTLSNPKGSQPVQIILEDGSKVWLNTGSSLTFYAPFHERRRLVELNGEAYFEVSKDKSKPFNVITALRDTVEVLGTRFNVNAYTDEASTSVVLIEGAVKIEQTRLSPGQGYRGGKVYATDPYAAIAWKDGYFSFDKSDLSAVLRQLSRWYDVSFQIEGQPEKREFTGKIGRNLSLNAVLDILGQSRIKYTIQDERTIKIQP